MKILYPDPRCACGLLADDCLTRPNCDPKNRKSFWRRFQKWVSGFDPAPPAAEEDAA